MQRITSLLVILLAISFCNTNSLQAQATGTLSGTVRDAQTGEPLPGATIKIEDTDLGDAANVNGRYSITDLAPKSYTVTASYVGYQSQKKYNVTIKSGVTNNLNFRLGPSVSELGEITVAPDPYEKPAENPLSRQELSKVQITSYPGGNNDIAKVVQSLPGVSGSAAGFRNDLIIRGGGPSENVYYLDGIEIPVINHFATQGSAGGPVGLLNVSFFEGVDLSSSSFPAQYSNVLSGVLQFDQRNGNGQDYGANIRLGASETALTVEGPLFKSDDEDYSNTTFIASVRRSYLQLLFKLIDLPFLPDYWDYQYKVHHKVNKYNEINITGVGSIDNFRINKPDDITAEQQATLDQIPIIKQTSSTGGISWKHRLKNADGFWRSSLSTSVFNNNFSRYKDNEQRTGLLQRNESRRWETTWRNRYKQFAGAWTFAGGFMLKDLEYRTKTYRSLNNIQFSTDFRFLRYGLFGQVTKTWIGGRLSTSLGIRADANTFTSQDNNLWNTLSPRLAISYDLGSDGRWKVNGSVGRYYKIPPTTILGFKNKGGSFANKDAEYIQSDHLVAGLTYQPRKSSQFSVEGFLKEYQNYPVSASDSVSLANLGAGFDVFGNEEIASVGKGRAYGIEFTYRQKLKDNFYGILAYTLYRSEFTGFDNEQYLPSLWDNRHLLTFTGGYKLGKSWEIAARMRLLGGTPYPALQKQASEQSYPTLQFDYSTLGNQRLDVFNSLDIRVDKEWSFRQWSMSVYLEVTNVLGSDLTNAPDYGLKRDDNGDPVSPNKIVQISGIDNSNTMPTLGVVVDI